jgi:hypothetical protein
MAEIHPYPLTPRTVALTCNGSFPPKDHGRHPGWNRVLPVVTELHVDTPSERCSLDSLRLIDDMPGMWQRYYKRRGRPLWDNRVFFVRDAVCSLSDAGHDALMQLSSTLYRADRNGRCRHDHRP